jgi:murein DD-endopeptidase MepM/ murein hydrolase activator NlpD
MGYGWLAYPITHGYITTYQGANTDTPHYANDIGTPYHTPITALFAGTVVSQRTHIAWGTEVFIQPTDKKLPQYYYYHLDVLQTKVGQKVNAGQTIGLSGGQNSGGSNPTQRAYSTGPHTHVGFFTKWVATPIGTRGYGPDITPYVHSLAKGQAIPDISLVDTGTASAAGTPLDGIAKIGEYVVEAFGISGTIVNAVATVSPQPFVVIGLSVMALSAAVLVGAWFLFNGGF